MAGSLPDASRFKHAILRQSVIPKRSPKHRLQLSSHSFWERLIFFQFGLSVFPLRGFQDQNPAPKNEFIYSIYKRKMYRRWSPNAKRVTQRETPPWSGPAEGTAREKLQILIKSLRLFYCILCDGSPWLEALFIC